MNACITIAEIADRLDLKPVSALSRLSDRCFGGYVSDLLSDVMAHARAGEILITLQVHPNVISVARLKGIAAIIVAMGREPEKETLARAEEENMPVLLSASPAFEIAGRLYKMGCVRGG